MCDIAEQMNAFPNIKLHTGRWFQSSLNSSSKEKLKYAKIRRHFFQFIPDKIYVEHTIQMYLQLCTLRMTSFLGSWSKFLCLTIWPD